MEDHSETIPEPPPPIHIDDGELTPTYDPSPDLAEIGPVISQIDLCMIDLLTLGLIPH